jgi:predicted membrane protein
MKNYLDKLPSVITDNIEIIGYIASVLVLLSFVMREIRWIRIISIVSCLFWIAYGLMIDALPIWMLNAALIFIHIFFLLSTNSTKKKRAEQTTEPTEPAEPLRTRIPSESFNKKGLRSLPWFFSGDIEA